MPIGLIATFIAVFFIGAAAVGTQLRNLIPGEGPASRMDNLALVTAQQAELLGSACINHALASPGVVGTNIATPLPPGVNTQQLKWACEVDTAPGGGRNVYAWLATSPGAAGYVMNDTDFSAVWHIVRSTGQAQNLVTRDIVSVPSAIPVGALVDIVYTST
ncbi:hypothetical protein [Burkholderia cepacia]|uniref:hypothetical protein n=1 Tax=Burkholderia cepacia TaxID=292 RepID=UPI001CF413F6|nr:hypothetical protein [Burkholderia cepacia]MCA8355598.1 hypothetical protein [Burkholderia cepacia]